MSPKAGDLIYVLWSQEGFFNRGDLARLKTPDKNGLWWADFNGLGNAHVEDDGIWCVGKPGRHSLAWRPKPGAYRMIRAGVALRDLGAGVAHLSGETRP